jgi:hypothetical protein
MAGANSGNDRSLEQTPTWAVAVVCLAFVAISIIIERAIHHVGDVRFCLLNLILFSLICYLDYAQKMF